MDVCALVISILAFAFSVLQFLCEASRQKKESTLNAYNELQNDVFSQLNKYPNPMPHIEYMSDEWETITVYLAKLERFSVGLNTGVYSVDVVNRIGGSYYIRQFEKLKDVIEVKKKKNVAKGKHYDEFEESVKMLIQYRKSKCKFIQKIKIFLKTRF